MTLDLYAWNTSNGRKISIMLEELDVDYNIHLINIGKDEQFAPEFLKISPNNRIPAIIDSDGPGGTPYSMFESGAILLYLADKFGKFNPTAELKRYETLVWLMWQMGGAVAHFVGTDKRCATNATHASAASGAAAIQPPPSNISGASAA